MYDFILIYELHTKNPSNNNVIRDAGVLFQGAADACGKEDFLRCYAMFAVFGERFPTFIEVGNYFMIYRLMLINPDTNYVVC